MAKAKADHRELIAHLERERTELLHSVNRAKPGEPPEMVVESLHPERAEQIEEQLEALHAEMGD